jgi:hypothetical protein
MYFFDESETDRSSVPQELVAALQNDDLRDMTLRATGLSERSLRAIKEMIESARAVEGRATITAPGTAPSVSNAASHLLPGHPVDESHQLQFK